MSERAPAVSTAVVIITADRNEHLGAVLEALATQRRRADEVIVVDMADASSVVAAAPLPTRHLRRLTSGSTLPLGAARNAGAEASTAEGLIFLDVDCIPHPELVDDYAIALAEHREVLACGTVRYLRRGWQTAGGPGGTVDLCRASAPHPARPTPTRATIDAERHELFWSLNFAVDATTWRRLGGFDLGYTGYGAEDTDLAFRARRLGIPLLWLPGAVAYHQWHEPTRLDPRRTSEIVGNARRFHERWGQWPMRGWLDELVAAGLVRFDPLDQRLETVEPDGDGVRGRSPRGGTA